MYWLFVDRESFIFSLENKSTERYHRYYASSLCWFCVQEADLLLHKWKKCVGIVKYTTTAKDILELHVFCVTDRLYLACLYLLFEKCFAFPECSSFFTCLCCEKKVLHVLVYIEISIQEQLLVKWYIAKNEFRAYTT